MSFIDRTKEKKPQPLTFKPLAVLAHLAPPAPLAALAHLAPPEAPKPVPEVKRIVMPVAPLVLTPALPAPEPALVSSDLTSFDRSLAEKATALYLSGDVTIAGQPMTASDAGVRFIILCWALSKMKQAPAALDELSGGRPEDTDPHGRWLARRFRENRERGNIVSDASRFPQLWGFAPGFVPPSTPLGILRFCWTSVRETTPAPEAEPAPEIAREEAVANVSGLDVALVRAPEPAPAGGLAEVVETMTALAESVLALHDKLAAQDVKLDEVLTLLRPYK
jgi:hypothetical protein